MMCIQFGSQTENEEEKKLWTMKMQQDNCLLFYFEENPKLHLTFP